MSKEQERLKDILSKVADGSLNVDDAAKLLAKERPKGPRIKSKKPSGRPKGVTQRKQDMYMAICTCWVLYHDKIPKMKLRDILCDALNIEHTYVATAISALNAAVKRGDLIGREVKNGIATVIFMTGQNYFDILDGKDPLKTHHFYVGE
jgi:hypothetical protein